MGNANIKVEIVGSNATGEVHGTQSELLCMLETIAEFMSSKGISKRLIRAHVDNGIETSERKQMGTSSPLENNIFRSFFGIKP